MSVKYLKTDKDPAETGALSVDDVEIGGGTPGPVATRLQAALRETALAS